MNSSERSDMPVTITRRPNLELELPNRKSWLDRGVESCLQDNSIKTIIESFYDRWYATWSLSIGEGESKVCTTL
jgi:hypothetical protein